MTGAAPIERANCTIRDLGHREYDDVHREMLAFAQTVQHGESPGEVWLVEHDSILTAGRATPAEDLVEGVRAIERGGKVTWHGPGQLVVYPIVRLPHRDVRDWLKRLEAFGVTVCADFGLSAEASSQGTGVYVDGRKVASIGVAVRRWVNLHGISINVDVDPRAFETIRPCGLDPAVMSDLSRLTGRRVTLDEVRAAARRAIPILTEP